MVHEATAAEAPRRTQTSGLRPMMLVARLAMLNQLRRTAATALLVLLPIAFYISLRRDDYAGNAVGGLVTGIGWAIAFSSLFGFRANAGVDIRITRSGMGTRPIFFGRLIGYAAIAVVLAAMLSLFALLVDDVSPSVTFVASLLAAVTAIPMGALIGVLIRGEIEGGLLVLSFYGIPFSLQPDSPALKAFPTYGALNYAYSLGEHATTSWIVHPIVYGAVASVAAAAAWHWSLRRGSALD